MIRTMRYSLSILLSTAVITFVIILLLRGARPETMDAFGLSMAAGVSAMLLPKEKGAWKGVATGLALVAWVGSIALYIYKFVRMSAADRGDILNHGLVFWSCLAGIAIIPMAAEIWRRLQSPTWKLVIATVAVTTTAVLGLFLAARLLHWAVENWHGIFIDNWGMTLIILYLPLMGLAWFGYDRWRKSRNRSNPRP